MIKTLEKIIKKLSNKSNIISQKYRDNKEKVKMFFLLFIGVNSFVLFFLGDKLNGIVLHGILIVTGSISFVYGVIDYKFMYTDVTSIDEILGLIMIGILMLIIGISYFL